MVVPMKPICTCQSHSATSQSLIRDSMAACKHLSTIKFTTTDKRGCEECLKMGDTWVHLRLCLECGHVGCCDSSKNKHATNHFRGTHHPLVRSIERGENWVWCYADNFSPGEITERGFQPMSD
jgi:uncharacterized UBP type Zn finger protein